MTPERASAYQRVMRALETVGPAKLQPAERDRVRDAADTLLFVNALDEAHDALLDIALLTDVLVTSGRWLEATLEILIADLLACGPENVPAAA